MFIPGNRLWIGQASRIIVRFSTRSQTNKTEVTSSPSHRTPGSLCTSNFMLLPNFYPDMILKKILFYQSRFLFSLCASSTVMTIGWVIFFPPSLFLKRGTDRLVWSACLYLYKSEYFLFIESTMYLSEREMGLYFQRKILGFVFCTIYGYVAPTPPCLMAPLNKFRA